MKFFGKFYGDETKTETETKTSTETETKKPNPEPKFFTQEEVNALLAENKRGLQAKVAELSQATADIPKYQAKLKEMSDSLLTKEELAKQEADRRKAEYDNAVKAKSEEAETWKNRYLENTFDVAIADAAAKNDAFDKDQLALILKPVSKVTEVTNEKGEGLGKYHVIATIEEGGKQLTLPVTDAVAKLKENPKYANQFRTGKIPGTGGQNFSREHGVPTGEVKSMTDFLKLTRNMKAAGAL